MLCHDFQIVQMAAIGHSTRCTISHALVARAIHKPHEYGEI